MGPPGPGPPTPPWPPAPPSPPTPPPGPPPPTGSHYQKPPCQSDEEELDTESGEICAPTCSGVCPLAPANCTAKPTCSDNARANDRLCYLICQKDSDCPSGAACDGTVCSYKSSTSVLIL